jgi:hypothetical protein
MSKAILYVKKGVIQGVFTNKKNLWRDLEKVQGDMSQLIIRATPDKVTDLTYPKMVQYLKERKMLNVYLREEIEKCVFEKTLDDCPKVYKIWELEMNEHYSPEWYKEEQK